MAGRGGAKKELDPEQLMKKKFRAKCLFRALGRLVMANAHWLIEDTENYEGVDNVKLRVQQAMRGKAKKKQLLSITDKALLNKPANERTEQEKKYIYRIIGGLKCFKRYPNHVKKKLAAVTYFKYYGPNRTIVRQHQDAHALYFIVSGEVIVSQMIYDELIQQYVSVEIGAMQAGDLFGEVSLLHGIPRTATVTTVGHCELLTLMKEDFKNVLQASVQQQWDEVKRAMSAFTYFDALDEVARREGCIVAKMKSYEPNETLLGDGVGVANFVYFVLSGRCQMIESIQVTIPVEESEQDLDTKYFGAYKNLRGSTETDESTSQRKVSVDRKRTESILKSSSSQNRHSTSRGGSVQISEGEPEVMKISSSGIPQQSSTDDTVLLDATEQGRESRRLSMIPEAIVSPLPPNLRTYFMQVCIFNPGSSFGFGENMRDRRIVALTPVDCMLLPKIWLLQRNTANIWTRIQHYLDKKIPTKKDLFKQFVQDRRWQEFRDQMVNDVVSRSNTVNWTSVHDVPYSIRMEEMLDI